MSLNGLDSAPVAEAYASALAEAGGWFLLKYASRDAVEILTRGAGGLVEARGAISSYEDKSPLYGFLLYRRRKVLIKYIPESTSRLLQARVTVHFQAVTEKFSPHDNILPVSTAEDLSDAALAAACSLHTAAPSSCSSRGSSRRRKLDEITEDAEEGQATADDTSSIARPMTAASTIPTIIEPWSPDTKNEAKSEASESTVRASMDGRPRTPQAKTAMSHVSMEAVLESADNAKTNSATADYVASLKNYEHQFESDYEARLSSQTARPSTSDLYGSIYYDYKPKVKLGPRPRPSVDGGKRPHTAGTRSKEDARPVSQLPPGLRIAQRKGDTKRPKSRDSSIVPSIAFPPPPPIPNMPELSLITPMRPTSSPASIRSLPARTPGMTPEKQRLMKALELRKRQQKSRKANEAEKAREDEQAREAAAARAVVAAVAEPTVAAEETATPPPEHADAEEHPFLETAPESQPASTTTEPSILLTQLPKADSVVEMPEDNHPESEDLQSASASSPTSAQTQGSSESPSTRPSSISEEEDHLDHDRDFKPELHLESAGFGHDVRSDASHSQDTNLEESVESSPTVVPDNASPVPSIEVIAPTTSRSENGRETVVQITPAIVEAVEPTPAEPSPSSPSASELKRRSTTEVREKRRALVEPIRIDLNADASDTEYLSDDSFMEELQSAKFEQAQPISVAKSPINPYFPRKSSVVNIPERSSSNSNTPPAERRSPAPEFLGGDRKSSGSWLTKPDQENLVIAKKINVSSGISQRIKALAEKSNRESTASVSPVTPPEASSSIVAQRKSSFRTPPSTSTGPSPVAQYTKRFSRQSFASFNSPSPDRQSISQLPETATSVYNVQQYDRLESVQVTARIIRDPRTQKPNLTMPTHDSPLELHQSPLIIDHQKAQKMINPMSSSKPSLARPEPASPELPASPQSKEASSAALPRSSSESSWRTLGRRMSEAKPPPTASSVRSQSVASSESFDEKKEDRKDKRDSMTSRLFKRMSSSMSISSASRKNLAALSPTVQEEDHEANLPSLRDPPPAVQVGDLNIQFPDTLLWKRRWVEIDGSGNIVLTLSKANENPRGITKKFHLTEFRPPYSPDQDVQELPNSVVLDFLDGRTLQCACETYVAQVHVLQILREAHEAWMAYGQ